MRYEEAQYTLAYRRFLEEGGTFLAYCQQLQPEVVVLSHDSGRLQRLSEPFEGLKNCGLAKRVQSGVIRADAMPELLSDDTLVLVVDRAGGVFEDNPRDRRQHTYGAFRNHAIFQGLTIDSTSLPDTHPLGAKELVAAVLWQRRQLHVSPPVTIMYEHRQTSFPGPSCIRNVDDYTEATLRSLGIPGSDIWPIFDMEINSMPDVVTIRRGRGFEALLRIAGPVIKRVNEAPVMLAKVSQ